MPDILDFEKYASCRKVTFPFCAFGTPYQKQTTLMFTPGLAPGLNDLDLLECTHDHSKDAKAGGSKENGIWNSAAAAKYPAELNLIIAYAIARLVSADRPPSLLPLSSRPKAGFETGYEVQQRVLAEARRSIAGPESSAAPPAPRHVDSRALPPSDAASMPAPPATPRNAPPRTPARLPSSKPNAPVEASSKYPSRSATPIRAPSFEPAAQAPARMQNIPEEERPDIPAARLRPKPHINYRASIARSNLGDDGNGHILLISGEEGP